MRDLLRVESEPSLRKDPKSSAMSSVDDNGYKMALERKRKQKKMDRMEEDINELKSMMSLILQKLNK